MLPVPFSRRSWLISAVGPDASGSKPGIECVQMPERSGMEAEPRGCPKTGAAAADANVTTRRKFRCPVFMLSSLSWFRQRVLKETVHPARLRLKGPSLRLEQSPRKDAKAQAKLLGATTISAVMAFSPGEYLEDTGAVARTAAQVYAPIYVTSSPDADEVSAAKAILAASPARSKTRYLPQFGVHGASTLIEAQDPKGVVENWKRALAFLNALPPAHPSQQGGRCSCQCRC